MKHSIAIGFVGLLLLAALTGCQQKTDTTTSSQPVSSAAAASDSVSSGTESSGATSDSSQTAIRQINDVPNVTWEVQSVSKDDISYEIPTSWTSIPEMEQTGISFYTASDADITLQPSNIVVEVGGQSSIENDTMDYSDPEVQQSFFDFIQQSVLSTMEDVVNSEFSVWNYNDTFVYIVEYDRSVTDTVQAHQTCFYPMGYSKTVVVYATDFNDEISPNVAEAAKAIVASLSTD